MCGINGIYNSNKTSNTESVLTSMNNLIMHRGPDDDGFFIENNKPFELGMCMRRLAIIDLKSGQQPIFNESKDIVIVFNGEIYNYKSIKNNLELEGVVFQTNTDTEVILKLYEKHGTKSFGMLDGMFAFSLYDKINDKLFVARDFFGEKPLYYYKTETQFFWASELKSLVSIKDVPKIISKNGLALYFQLTYIPSPYSIYKDIYKLDPNHFIEINCLTGDFKKKEILKNKTNYKNISFETSKKITQNLVQESVDLRAVSDVPIGTFLSGGVDSSIISYCLAQNFNTPINTFSVGFENKKFDETDKSKTIAKQIGSNHHEFILKHQDLKNQLDQILLNFDEPFADSSSIPSFFVSKLTRGHVKVALTGDGGDEIFGGYNKYYIGKLNQKYTHLIHPKVHKIIARNLERFAVSSKDKRGSLFKLNKLIKAIDYNDGFYQNIISLGFQKREISSLFKDHKSALNPLDSYLEDSLTTLKDFRNMDKKISLEGDMLVKVDRTSMLNSLECRSPFLSTKLWDFTNQIPDGYLLNGWDKKYLLKESFKQVFPKNFLNKSKKGFEIPVGDWLRDTLKEELLSYIDIKLLETQNIFNIEYIFRMVNEHIEGLKDNTFRVWTFYCFQKWYYNTFENYQQTLN